MSQLTVPWREPILDRAGNLSPPWITFYNELITRVGGTGNVVDVAKIIALLDAAQALIDYQSVQPQDAGAQEALRRIAELETLIPPAPNLAGIRAKLEELEAALLDVLRPLPAPAVEAWIAPSLTNSWADYGSPFNPSGYYRDPYGVVHLRGTIKSGVVGSSAFTLPSGYRPANTELFAAISNGAVGRAAVDNSGGVTPDVGSNVYFSLDGMTFRAA